MLAKTLRLDAQQAIFGARVYIFGHPKKSTKLAESIFSHLPVPGFIPGFIITGEERTEEVARMLSGAKLTETSRKHAEQMLKTNA